VTTAALCWDYTELADAYLQRPDYAPSAIAALLQRAGVNPGDPACDIGAGAGHLTQHLAAHGLCVVAIEPNGAMQAHGVRRTARWERVRWCTATGEDTGQAPGSFGLVTFGSSFNVLDRELALRESARILRPRGWIACLWNHRDLSDPIQARIESLIAQSLPGYTYGTRREDPCETIAASGSFEDAQPLQARVVHRQDVAQIIRAWSSHATLARQAGARFETVVAEIAAYLRGLGQPAFDVPYTTRVWMARKRC
jgi:ubiquinone/menaquinone biosynthesis C-methylase UbiE